MGDISKSDSNNSGKSKNENLSKSKSGKKNKSSKNKAAKSKLASEILSSKNGEKSSEENDEGRNTNSVVLDNSNVFMDTIKDTILKDLKDSDFVMETPSAAIFTLVVGKYYSFNSSYWHH